MAVTFEDYYRVLGIERSASAEQIKRAYRKLARTHHPDVNQGDPDAAGKFAKVSEAYEVLSDPQKRQKYDRFGQHWKHGQRFDPREAGVEGFDNVHFRSGGPGGFDFQGGQFSDFFEMMFGPMHGGRHTGSAHSSRTGGASFDDLFGRDAGHAAREVHEQTHDLIVTLEEVYHGATKQLSVRDPDGATRTLDVKVPRGVKPGGKIRLKGQGLLLRVRLAPHPTYTPGHAGTGDLTTQITIDPATAALGGTAEVPTLDGPVSMTIPPGTSSGAKLRLRGRGLPIDATGDARGDLFARVMIAVPRTLNEAQRAAYERLRDAGP